MNKKVVIVGIIAYVSLLVLSVYFYRERTIFLDAAYHLFAILKDGDFAIQNFRFGAFFTQSFPLVGSKLGLSLTTIMKLYSASFVIFHFLVFLLCTLLFKQYKFGLAILLFSVFMIADTFYWIQSELIQGLAFLILYFGFLSFGQKHFVSKKDFWFFPINALMVITLVFFHPLLIFPFFFLIGYFILNRKISKPLLMQSGIAFILLYVVKLLFFKVDYDSVAMGGVKNFITLFPNYFNLQSHVNFFKYAVTDYYLFPLGLSLLIIFYIKKKEFRLLTYVVSASLLYLFFINVSFPNVSDQFYIESFYLILSIFVVFPLVFDIVPSIKLNVWFISLCLILILRIGHIGINHRGFTERLVWLQSFHTNTLNDDHKKMIVSNINAPMDLLMMTWSTPYEFWLLSTSETGQSRSIIFDDNPESLRWIIPEKNKFLSRWGAFDYNSLPPPYFHFRDSSQYIIKE